MDYESLNNICNRILATASELDGEKRTLRRTAGSISDEWRGADADAVILAIENMERELAVLSLELEDIQRDILVSGTTENNGV